MKKFFSKVLISGLALVLMSGTALPAFATDTVAGFDDVDQGSWYYDSVMAMAQMGYISGTKAPDANGVGEYSPDSTMTRGQFVAIVVRIMYQSELNAMGNSGSEWWRNAYNLAVAKGLLNPSELNQGDMEKPMSREEMALVLARASTQRGETPSQLIKSAAIPDYNKVSFAYRDSVIQVYSMGLLAGVDNAGTFSPSGTLTRAQAAAVIYRLIEPSTRVQVDFNKVPQTQTQTPTNPGQTTTGTQTWTEGQAHGQPKEGDVVVKADGTQVVIKRGIGGVLGAGQGINIWAGYKNENDVDMNYYNGIDSGKDMTALKKDSKTGEMHTKHEWQSIMSATNPNGKFVGSYDQEIYENWWQWDASFGDWVWIAPY